MTDLFVIKHFVVLSIDYYLWKFVKKEKDKH